jgi:hypothetical protein
MVRGFTYPRNAVIHKLKLVQLRNGVRGIGRGGNLQATRCGSDSLMIVPAGDSGRRSVQAELSGRHNVIEFNYLYTDFLIQ